MAGGGSVASNDDDSGAPVSQFSRASRSDSLEFFGSFLAVWTVFGVGDIFILFVWKEFFDSIKNSGTADARVE